MYDKEGNQEPCDTIELAGEAGVQLSEQGSDDGFHTVGE
jgi:hypothetical protein